MNEEEATTAADVVMVDGSDDDTDSVPTQASVPAVDEQTQKTNEEKENNEEKKDEQQPANTLRANIGLLNDYLICPLCKGYFRDAHTIPECLHTCIHAYIIHTYNYLFLFYKKKKSLQSLYLQVFHRQRYDYQPSLSCLQRFT